MKQTKLKGIAHDLANHLDFQIWFGHYKDIKNQSTNAIENKNSFDKMCIAFFKERLPKSFEFNRIKELNIEINRTMTSLNIKVEVKIDDQEFSYKHKSFMS